MKKIVVLWSIVPILMFFNHFASAQVRINEFLSDNVAFNPEMVDYDDFSDWIELYNAGSEEADISGYYLTGDLKQPKKWQIPAGASIPAGDYLLIWADGNNAKPGTRGQREGYSGGSFTTEYYHAAFRLGKGGEQVGLFDKSGAVVDSVTFPKQYPDVSMGRASDGKWGYFDEPTPGAVNSTTVKKVAQFAGNVTFSVGGGFYAATQTVILTASDGSGIYYTTDGSWPYAGTAKKYSTPLSVSENTVIRARCIANDKLAGKIITNTYFIKEKARALMVVTIATDQKFLDNKSIGIFQNIIKYREVPVVLEFYTTDGKPVAKTNAGIQVGSLTNMSCPMKPLQVSLKPKYGDEFVEYKFFESRPYTKFNRFRLRQGGDAFNTNYIADDLLDPICRDQMLPGVQAYRGVVVYINGKYYGIMDLREQFRDQYFKDNYGVTDADLKAKDEVRRFIVGGAMSSTEGWDQVSGTWNAYASMMSLVKSGTINLASVAAQVDLAHMSDYVIMESWACNSSWGHNEDMWKVPNSKWRWLTTDIDRCFETSGDYSTITTDIISGRLSGSSSNFMTQDTLFGKLMKGSTEYKHYFCQRYAAHMASTFSNKRLVPMIDSIVALLEPEMPDHVAKWSSQRGITSVSKWKNTDIGDLKKFCSGRSTNIYGHLATFEEGGTVGLTVMLNPANSQADIFINGIRMCSGLSGIKMFKDAPFTVRAVGKPGFKCTGWEGGSAADSMSVTLNKDYILTANFNGAAIDQSPGINTRPYGISVHPVIAGGSVMLHLGCSLKESDKVKISLYNLAGQRIEDLMDDYIPAGLHSMTLRSKTFAAGVFYLRISTSSTTRTVKIALR